MQALYEPKYFSQFLPLFSITSHEFCISKDISAFYTLIEIPINQAPFKILTFILKIRKRKQITQINQKRPLIHE
jgi:hypothetical protein